MQQTSSSSKPETPTREKRHWKRALAAVEREMDKAITKNHLTEVEELELYFYVGAMLDDRCAAMVPEEGDTPGNPAALGPADESDTDRASTPESVN